MNKVINLNGEKYVSRSVNIELDFSLKYIDTEYHDTTVSQAFRVVESRVIKNNLLDDEFYFGKIFSFPVNKSTSYRTSLQYLHSKNAPFSAVDTTEFLFKDGLKTEDVFFKQIRMLLPEPSVQNGTIQRIHFSGLILTELKED